MIDTSKSSQVRAEEMAFLRAWIYQIAGSGVHADGGAGQNPPRYSSDVPFSFTCGGRSSREWARLETAAIESGAWQDGQRRHLLRWSDAQSGLACALELTEFSGFPAMEWVIRLRNAGESETQPVANFNALDLSWLSSQAGEYPELRRAFGSDGRFDDFQYTRDEMRQSMWDTQRVIRMDSAANLPFRQSRNGSASGLEADSRTSATWLPFFNLRSGGDGILTALGWSGQWFARFAYDCAGKTTLAAGMEHLELKLRAGEEIRSPRVLILYWQGDPLHAHNMLRRFLLEHHTPRIDGRPVQMPLCNGSWGGTPTPGHLDAIQRIAAHGLAYDYYWVDAGWYGTSSLPCPDVFHGEWGITGDWRVNRNYHPDGLKPISEAAHRAGMKFLLWIEPLRARYGTPVTLEHPEWFLRRGRGEVQHHEDLLLNLGHPGAWQWAVETVSGLIDENGIDCYREDFNIDPAPFWALADVEGRKGLTEMRFIEGVYAFWDELRRRHPGLLIDNCASGGRRLDLEMISRGVALWRTDYNCFPDMRPEAAQLHTLGLNLWLPMNSTSPMATPGDTYQARSSYSTGLVFNVEEFGISSCQAPDFPWDWFSARIAEVKRLQPYFYGDFYPLTPFTYTPDAWSAFQVLDPAQQAGAVLAFRRPESGMTRAAFQLQGLDADRTYRFECADSGAAWTATGAELMQAGLPLEAATPRSSRLLFYSS